MGVAFSQQGNLLDERFPGTGWLVAAETADAQIDDGLPASNREIGQVALVTAVERFGPSATHWAVGA